MMAGMGSGYIRYSFAISRRFYFQTTVSVAGCHNDWSCLYFVFLWAYTRFAGKEWNERFDFSSST